MGHSTGRNANTNDEATVDDEVEITGNVAVSAVPVNVARIYVAISILSEDAFVRFIPAATDNSTRKGVFVPKNSTYELPTDNMYTGEISIINAKNNKKPLYYITEY